MLNVGKAKAMLLGSEPRTERFGFTFPAEKCTSSQSSKGFHTQLGRARVAPLKSMKLET